MISSLVHWVTQLHCFISEGPGKMSIPWLLFLSYMGVTILGVWWKQMGNSGQLNSIRVPNAHFPASSTCPFGVAGMAYLIVYSNKAEDHKCEYLLLVPGVKQGMSTVALGANSCPDVLWKGLHKEGRSCIVKALNAFFGDKVMLLITSWANNSEHTPLMPQYKGVKLQCMNLTESWPSFCTLQHIPPPLWRQSLSLQH